MVVLQLFTILVSHGNVYLLGEAYAFGVIWSFTFNSLAMLVLRFKYKGERGWKVPPNIYASRATRFRSGWLRSSWCCSRTAIVNLFTKSIATIAGVAFAGAFFLIFTVSEKPTGASTPWREQQMKEHFQLAAQRHGGAGRLGMRPGNVLVTVRDYNTLNHLKWVLERTDTKEQDIVVMSARVSHFGAAAYDLSMEQIFSDYEQTLFTRAVSVAESFGKHVSLLVVPARDVWSAIVQTANQSGVVRRGVRTFQQDERPGAGLLSGPRLGGDARTQAPVCFSGRPPGQKVDTFRIGPHTPTLKTEDVHMVHRLWLNITREPGLDKLHHHDILTEALTRFARDYSGHDRQDILRELRKSSGVTVPTRALGEESGELTKATVLPPAPEADGKKDDEGPSTPPIVGP